MHDPLHALHIAVGQVIEGGIKPLEETLLLAVLGLDEQGGQGRRERQGDDAGEDHGYGDGDGELLVERTGDAAEEGHRQEHGIQHQYDSDDGAAHLVHGPLGGGLGVELELDHVPLGVLDDDNGVVHDEADG